MQTFFGSSEGVSSGASNNRSAGLVVPQNGLAGLWSFNPANLLLKSEVMNVWPWSATRVAVSLAPSVPPPVTASGSAVWHLKSNAEAAPAQHFLQQYFPLGSPHDLIYAVDVKPDTARYIYLSPSGTSQKVWFDLHSGAVGVEQGQTSGTIENLGDGWFRCIIEYDHKGMSVGALVIGLATQNGNLSFVGDGMTAVWLAAPQVNFRVLRPYEKTDMNQIIGDESGNGRHIVRGAAVGANTDDSRLLPIGGLEFDGINDFLSRLPAKNPSGWTVINAREDRVEAVDSAGGSFVDGFAQPGASEWPIGMAGAYKGHLNFLAYYNRVLSPNEQKQAFDAIVDTYSQRPGYEFVSKPVLNISFDDSRATDYTQMFPVFRSRGVNGTSFVTTSHINRNDSDPFYLSENRIRMMRGAGWEFGSHNVVHVPLPTLSEARIRAELANSKSDIQRILPGYMPLCYAYTTGAYTARIRKIVLEYYPYARDAGGAYLNGTQVAPSALIVKRDLYNVPLATLKADIDEALSSGKMLLWYTHITTAADGERIGAALDYAISRGLPIMTMADAMGYMRNPLLSLPAARR